MAHVDYTSQVANYSDLTMISPTMATFGGIMAPSPMIHDSRLAPFPIVAPSRITEFLKEAFFDTTTLLPIEQTLYISLDN